MTKRILTLLSIFLIGSLVSLFAQEDVVFHGKVMDKKTGEPVIGAAVHLVEIERWTVTDKDGNFSFRDIAPKTYTVEIQCLCYELFNKKLEFKEGVDLIIDLVPISYDMEEVNVLAKKGTNMASSTTIGAAAIEHTQATSLSDIMQLLPGSLVVNPDLSDAQQISIREIGNDVNSAIGTSIIVDNAPISNDANLQTISTNSSSGAFESVAGGGVDLRQISTNNIESVEVIKGIPSVVYGNLTSGAVLVNTKAGYSPLNVSLKSDPKIKQAAFDKGIKLSDGKSYLNLSLDYLSSFSDVASKYEGFKRITGQTAYSTTFMKELAPLSLNIKLSAFSTIDNEKTDPDAMVWDEEFESKDRGARMNIYGRWNLDKKIITDLNYTYSVSYTHQESYQMMYRSAGVEPISLSTEVGENVGKYLVAEEMTELTIDGKPVNIFGQLTASKILNFDNGILNKTLAGIDYRLDGNYGEGQLYDIANPPYVSSRSSRPRSFKDIPALQSYAFYIEDKLTLPIRTTKLSIQAGARLNNFQPYNMVNSEVGYYLEPRFNLQYNILNNKNNTIFDLLTLNAGIGKNYKSPSLLYLYPDDAWVDYIVLNHYDDDYPNANLAVFYTYNFNTENPDLKPSESRKKEVGLDFVIGKISGNITAFYEKQLNGFQQQSVYQFVDAYRYDDSDVPRGVIPDISTLPVERFNRIIEYRSAFNTSESEKSGVEFSIDFGKIKALYTSITLDGAYLKTIRVEHTEDYAYLPNSFAAEQYEIIGVYPAGESRVSQRLNTNLRMVTHIPQLRMIFSTTLQMTWFDKYYYPLYNEVPLYFYDREGNVIELTDEIREDGYYRYFFPDHAEFYWDTEILPPLFLANVKLSKEIEDRLQLSLFVNNFFNYRPMHQLDRTDGYTRRNPTIYFGAEIKFKL